MGIYEYVIIHYYYPVWEKEWGERRGVSIVLGEFVSGRKFQCSTSADACYGSLRNSSVYDHMCLLK